LGHSKSDKCVYRTREEELAWLARDPIKRCRRRLLQDGDVTETEIDELQRRVQAEIDDAAERALACPPVLEETLHDYVAASTGA
jgi:TPP-dependent pyruvate/acetoin dehydrogenase alpha subunit